MKTRFSVLLGLASLPVALALSAPAAAVTLLDTYVGGGGTGPYTNADSIGGGIFTISSADINRIGTNGNTLQVVINTTFAGHSGQDFNVGNGALFITPGVWNPTGSSPWLNDVYQAGDWQYAVTMPAVANSGSGPSGLYLTSGGTVIMSNVNGDP